MTSSKTEKPCFLSLITLGYEPQFATDIFHLSKFRRYLRIQHTMYIPMIYCTRLRSLFLLTYSVSSKWSVFRFIIHSYDIILIKRILSLTFWKQKYWIAFSAKAPPSLNVLGTQRFFTYIVVYRTAPKKGKL